MPFLKTMLFSSLFLFSWLQLAVDAMHPNNSHFLNITGIYPLSALQSPLSPTISRDAPYILKLPADNATTRNPLWVFSDTETFTKSGKQAGFVSNSAAWDVSDRGAVLDRALFGGGEGRGEMVVTDFLMDNGAIRRPWIPFVEDEIRFNRENAKGPTGGDGRRIALWPNGPPVPVNSTHAFLYCTIIQVTPESPTEPGYMGWRYLFRGITLVTVVLKNSGVMALDQLETITARRTVPKLFTEKDISWGNFNVLIGSCGTQGNTNSSGTGGKGSGAVDGRRCIYPVAIGARGLFLAKASLEKAWDKGNYTYYSPPNSAFLRVPPTHTSTTAAFIQGTFSSGHIFFSTVYNTFLVIYFNRLVDNSFYIRYLDLSTPLTHINGSTIDRATWPANKHITADEVQAIVKYAWSKQYRLYETKQGKGGFSYAGGVSVEYFDGFYDKNPDGGFMAGGKGTVRGDERQFVLLTWTMQTGDKVVGYDTLSVAVEFSRLWRDGMEEEEEVGEEEEKGLGGDNSSATSTIHTSLEGTKTVSSTTTQSGTQEAEDDGEVEKPNQSHLPWDNIYTRGDLEKPNGTDKGGDKKSVAGRLDVGYGYSYMLWWWAFGNGMWVMWVIVFVAEFIER